MPTARDLIRTLTLGTLLACSSCSNTSSADFARISRFLEFWSPPKGTWGAPFSGHMEWMILPSQIDSETTLWLGRRNDWEAKEHAKIDSISDAESMKPAKASMHAFIRCVFGVMRIEILFPVAAASIRPEFLRNHTATGDSVLQYAEWLLAQNDSLALEIQASAQQFNRLSRTLGLSDTIRYRAYQVPRRRILYDYVYFLSPEEKEYLLVAK
jgi:hypothetical protein